MGISWKNEPYNEWFNPKPSETILEEAQRLCTEDRNKSYGSAGLDFTRTGKLWGAILDIEPVSPHKVALCMAAMKLSRESYKHSRDSTVDACGYIFLADQVAEDETQT
jgi:hypothetical protein